mmetsp:Transcript_1771/g.4799  ORF Transcript_1771/g.4799 Transcript_1771/m.4799 type:complete len:144 (-) Transcript_1771:337-768(-)
MEPSRNPPPSSPPDASLHENFSTAANALTHFYKKSLTAEKEAREAGAESAYLAVVEWARSRCGRSGSSAIDVSALEQFCLTRVQCPSSAVAPGEQLSDNLDALVVGASRKRPRLAVDAAEAENRIRKGFAGVGQFQERKLPEE